MWKHISITSLSLYTWKAPFGRLCWYAESEFKWFFYIFFIFFSVRLFVGSAWSFGFSSPPQRPMTSDCEGFSIPDVIHYIFFPNLILEKEPVFSLFNVECQTRELLVPFLLRLWYDAVLVGGLNPGPPALEASTLPLGYRGSGWV